MAPVLQGLGTALILAIVEQVRNRDEQTRAVAALSKVAPREVPRATGLLRQFLRASFDQHERLHVPLEEELAVVRAYLDIESLRLGDRLKVEQTIDPGLLKVLMPPFSFQPLRKAGATIGIAETDLGLHHPCRVEHGTRVSGSRRPASSHPGNL
jgi:LytS/YehU family sensor histidine kinase